MSFQAHFATALLCVAASSPQDTAPPRAWPHESSDIPVNPRIHFGALENGLRYAWVSNGEPKKRCFLRLHVDVGSLAEEDHEQGMAHFLEHMAFNGSRSFPPGTLIEWFQEHGMAFGADTNAFTAYGQTVYMLDLPEADQASLEDGLRVLRDYADGLLLSDEEILKEKGVVDGEERERDSAFMRMFERYLELAYDGTRLPLRDPIGAKEDRDAFDSASVRRFYEKWYRPDNMTLILVGDLGELDPLPSLRKAFGDMRIPSEDRPAEPSLGTPSFRTPFFHIYEPEIPTVSVGIDRLTTELGRMTSRTWIEEQTPLDLALAMLNLRFVELVKQDDAPFLSAGAADQQKVEVSQFDMAVFDGVGSHFQCRPESWKAALSSGEQELRRAIQYGFREEELDEVRKDTLRSFDEAVKREKKKRSERYVQELLNAAEGISVPTDAGTALAIHRPSLDGATIEQCQQALAKAWNGGRLVIGAGGSLDLGSDAAEILRTAYEESLATEIEPAAGLELAPFAYASEPEGAPIASRETIEDLGIHRVRFENGVEVWIKKTDFAEQTILVQASLGEGLLSLAPEESARAYVADQVFEGLGLEAHSQDDLRRLTAGRVVGAYLYVAPDRFFLTGGTTPEDLLFECELLCAHLNHPGWRQEGMVQFEKNIDPSYEQLEHQHHGPRLLSFLPELHAGDPRFGLPGRGRVEGVTLGALRDWLAPELTGASLQVVFVGDLDVERTVEAAARTFGRLGRRRALEPREERRKIAGLRTGLRSEHEIDTETPSSLVVLAFPTADGRDAAMRCKLEFLGEILGDRLLKHVREKLGASYGPGAYSEADEVFEGRGILWAQAMGQPGREQDVVDACLGVARELAENGTTEEEVERLREPVLNRLRDARRENGFWLDILSKASRRPETLDELRDLEERYRRVEAQELSELAKEVLEPERASVLVVRPKPRPAEEKPAEKSGE